MPLHDFNNPQELLDAYRNGFKGAKCDPVLLEKFLASLPMPRFATAGLLLKGSGKGKLSTPYKSVYRVSPIKPYLGAQKTGDCFIAGTQVTMADGTLKNIEDIKSGDRVLSGDNTPRLVISTLKKKFSGHLITLKTIGFSKSITCTPDHQFSWFPHLGYGARANYVNKGNKNDNKNQEWKAAGALNERERISIPFGHTVGETQVLDINDYVTDCELVGDDRITIKQGRFTSKRFIPVDEKLGWLLGIYLAEGGGDDTALTFSLNSNEIVFAAQIQEAFRSIFDVDTNINYQKEKDSVMLVQCFRGIIARFFHSIMPGNVYTKRAPLCIYNAPYSVRLACIRGWSDGDGHCQNATERKGNSKGYYSKVTNVSCCYNLLQDMERLCLSCQLRPTITMRKQEKHQRVPSGSVNLYSDCVIKLYPEHEEIIRSRIKITKKKIDVTSNGLALPIKSIETQEVKDVDVYCIGVDVDHSFIANGFKAKNCVSWGTRNAVDVSRAVQIDAKHTLESFITVGATEVIYASRGHGGQGMACSQAAEFVHSRGGVILRKNYGKYDLTEYMGETGWGARGGAPEELVKIASEHPVKTTTQIRNIEEARDALANGYAIAVCSNQGFNSTRDKNGFAAPQGSWGHCAVPGTSILTSAVAPFTGFANYINKAIETIKLGDMVQSHTGENRKVTNVFERDYNGQIVILTVEHINPNYRNTTKEELRFTLEHPFLVGNDWKQAKDLTTNDVLVGLMSCMAYSGGSGPSFAERQYPVKILDVSRDNYVGKVYNLEVDVDNSYVAQNVCVHNCMMWGACDDTGNEPAFLVQNSWAKWNDGGHPAWGPIPDGSFLIRADVADRMLKSDGSFAFSSVVGFPPVKLPDYGSKDYL